MQTINHKQLYDLIANTSGAAIVGILALTDAKAKKTGNPFPEKLVFKMVRAVAFVGANYQNAVEREQTRQGVTGIFEAESLPWGQWAIDNKIIEHKGEFYLRTQSTPGQRRNQAARLLGYFDFGGDELTREQVAPFLPATYESAKQQDEAELTQTVWVRNYKFSSLLRVRINGKTYKVKNPLEK